MSPESSESLPGGSVPSYFDDEISLIELVNVLLKYRRAVILTPLIVFLLVVTYSYFSPRTYTATMEFLPHTSEPAQSIGTALAAQFGITIPSTGAGQSPAFYADLVTSTEILCPLLDSLYTVQSGTQPYTATIPKLLKIKDEDIDCVTERAVVSLRRMVTVSNDRETGVVTFSVKSRWADFSFAVVEDIVSEINRFNLETRKSQAELQRIFIEGRMLNAQEKLRSTEDALQEFLQKNRQWQGSPELEFVHDRLYREVDMYQQIYTSLAQSYEQARIDEVRDLPVISVILRPRLPAIPDRRRLLLKGILALMVGGMIGVFLAFGREFMVRGRARETDTFEEFEHLKRETLDDLTHPWRIASRKGAPA